MSVLNNLQKRVSAPRSHLGAEYKELYIIQCHKMDEITLLALFIRL